jgi:hypothetical protein
MKNHRPLQKQSGVEPRHCEECGSRRRAQSRPARRPTGAASSALRRRNSKGAELRNDLDKGHRGEEALRHRNQKQRECAQAEACATRNRPLTTVRRKEATGFGMTRRKAADSRRMRFCATESKATTTVRADWCSEQRPYECEMPKRQSFAASGSLTSVRARTAERDVSYEGGARPFLHQGKQASA